MGFHLRQPTTDQLAALLERSRSDSLTYGPIGGSLNGSTPPGLRRHAWSMPLRGAATFDRAAAAIRAWAVHRGAGLAVAVDGLIEAGTNVALSAPLPIGFVDVSCRIVTVVDEPGRYGFAYGTLSVHPERGEESFIVVREGPGASRFDVQAVSRPHHSVARLLPALGDRLQDGAVRRYLAAMQRVCAE